MKKLLSIIISVIMVCMLCVVPTSAASVKLNKKKANIPIGYTVTLKLSGAENVKWSSEDKTVAKVKSTKENTAKILGVKTGTTYIYAKADGKTYKCKVTVKKSFLTADKDSVSLNVGEKHTVTVKVTGSKKVTYSNSNSDVCAVSAKWNGDNLRFTVRGKSSGTAKIRVYTKGYSKSTAETFTVTVSGGNSVAISSDSAAETDNSMAEQVVALVNKEREKLGLSAVTLDEDLQRAADVRVVEITEKFSHTRPDGRSCFTAFKEAGISYGAAAENIAAGRTTAEGVMKDWMNSPGHKANILNPDLKKIGVGYLETSDIYGTYWVQVFTD